MQKREGSANSNSHYLGELQTPNRELFDFVICKYPFRLSMDQLEIRRLSDQSRLYSISQVSLPAVLPLLEHCEGEYVLLEQKCLVRGYKGEILFLCA